MAPLDLLPPVTVSAHPWRWRWLGTRTYWLAQAAGWGGYCVLDSIGVMIAPADQRTSETMEAVAVAVCGVFITHLLRIPLLYHWRRSRSWLALAVRVLPWWLALGTLYALMLSFLMLHFIFRDQLEAGTLLESDGLYEFATLVSFSLFFTGAWMCACFGIIAFQGFRTAQLEHLRLSAAVKEAELRALKAQINPHFLFNTLNTVRALVPRDLVVPRRAVTSLSELLRAALHVEQAELIPLVDEMHVVDNYLDIEQLRHEARLHVERCIDAEALRWEVPPFAIQTLVENAIKHGIATLPAGGVVTLLAAVNDDRLVVTVTNPGSLETKRRPTGLGVHNVRSRLALLFGSEAALDLAESSPGLVTARLTLPRRSIQDSFR